ncbi:hypothetical protein C0Q70_01725 [Pomacea canaliculata]|uniref:Uncharacterized protein n=2 Tax=Pomacea canaliculata TaxID=400727 RepID=A0A2T7Q0D0_POMCA|nr:hypothetical protein C0Q70_01725 [Pomacea canaliculata]
MSGLNHKPNEAGWFYHAPTKKETDYQPVGAPPPSQIPGLGQMEEFEQEKPKELVFRETDTKYIRLAKMGGRKDLLTINSNSANTSEPVSYPRCDWFYLEDNALEDKPKEDKKWEFLLPEYMVHHAYQPHGDTAAEASNGVPMRRPPYATENQSCFYQDGHSLSDKTVSLPEIKRPGYGTRNAKAANSKQPTFDKDNPLSSQALKNHPRPNYQL